VDPHVHLIPGGLFLKTVNLRGLQGGRQQLADRLAAAAAAAAAAGDGSSGGSNGGRKAWLIGVGWSESDWGGELPDKTWIDEVSMGCWLSVCVCQGGGMDGKQRGLGRAKMGVH